MVRPSPPPHTPRFGLQAWNLPLLTIPPGILRRIVRKADTLMATLGSAQSVCSAAGLCGSYSPYWFWRYGGFTEEFRLRMWSNGRPITWANNMQPMDVPRICNSFLPQIQRYTSAYTSNPFLAAHTDSTQYVGRWSATPNRLRKDGTFPGTSTPVITITWWISGSYLMKVSTSTWL